ncbi:two-component system sensor histidine kinase NtrB [Sphingomonas zeicaulis]|uniref:two-component system sensor histidine kinase NtrB n=1 Tax=Sphingomonas zeicaulis TaxID=1632740 RepID=UPI003D1EA8F7
MALPGSGLIRFGRRAPARDDAPQPGELLFALPEAMLLVDPDDLVVSVNAAAENLLNLSSAAMVGRTVDDAFAIPAEYRELPAGRETSGFAAYDLAIETPRGQRFRADFIVVPIVDRAGWRMMLIHVGAAAHRMGHRLERSGGTMTAIAAAAMLAHEIKNPLSGISGAAQLLESSLPEGERALTRLIRSEVDRIAQLIDRMEDFTDTRPMERKAENIYAILEHARDLACQGVARDVDLREVYDPSLPPVLVNRDALIQVLLNLIKNAAEAIEGQSRPAGAGRGAITLTTAYRHGVSVSVSEGGRRLSLPIELCVIDDGPGAPPEIVDHLFDPFVSSKRSGRGLGLTLVDKLVRDMGGIVQHERLSDPGRTVFRLLLPRAKAGEK